MDEPTSALADSESRAAFSRDRRPALRAGTTVLYISHKMNEIFELADRVVVLRDGQFVASVPRGETSPGQVVRYMVGREIAALDYVQHPIGKGCCSGSRAPVPAQSCRQRPAQFARHHVFGSLRRGAWCRGALGRRPNRAFGSDLRREPAPADRFDSARGPSRAFHPSRPGDQGRDRHDNRGSQDARPLRPDDCRREYHTEAAIRSDFWPACESARPRSKPWIGPVKELAIKTAWAET